MSCGRTYERDLISLVPDNAYRDVVGTLLHERLPALRIRAVTFETEVVPNRDPGCLKEAPAFLRRSLETTTTPSCCLTTTGVGRSTFPPTNLRIRWAGNS